MSGEFGVTSESQALQNLIVSDPRYMHLKLDAAATAAVGQVIQYNTTEDNWDDYTAGMAAEQYAIVAETKTISGDTFVSCLVKGEVRKAALDATAQADAEIEVALLKSGIIARPDTLI